MVLNNFFNWFVCQFVFLSFLLFFFCFVLFCLHSSFLLDIHFFSFFFLLEVVNVQDFYIIVSDWNPSAITSTFGLIPLGKKETPYTPSYGLNSTTNVLASLWLHITHEGWYAIKQRNQTKPFLPFFILHIFSFFSIHFFFSFFSFLKLISFSLSKVWARKHLLREVMCTGDRTSRMLGLS